MKAQAENAVADRWRYVFDAIGLHDHRGIPIARSFESLLEALNLFVRDTVRRSDQRNNRDIARLRQARLQHGHGLRSLILDPLVNDVRVPSYAPFRQLPEVIEGAEFRDGIKQVQAAA